jgi:hypothetical protein
MTEPRKLLILVGSPRRTGNSATIARAVQRGAETAGVKVALRFIETSFPLFFATAAYVVSPAASAPSRINSARSFSTISSRPKVSSFVTPCVGTAYPPRHRRSSTAPSCCSWHRKRPGEVARDPGDPLLGADQLGRDIFELKESIPTSESIPSEVVESGRLRIEHRLPPRVLLPLKSALKRYFWLRGKFAQANSLSPFGTICASPCMAPSRDPNSDFAVHFGHRHSSVLWKRNFPPPTSKTKP